MRFYARSPALAASFAPSLNHTLYLTSVQPARGHFKSVFSGADWLPDWWGGARARYPYKNHSGVSRRWSPSSTPSPLSPLTRFMPSFERAATSLAETGVRLEGDTRSRFDVVVTRLIVSYTQSIQLDSSSSQVTAW